MFTNNIAHLDPISEHVYSGYNDPFSAYLGPNSAPTVTDPHSKRNRNTWTLSDAKSGKSEYLGNTITDSILSEETWSTKVFFPFRYTDNIHFSWTKFENNAHLMHETPAYAASRLITQRKYTRSDSIRKVGIAYEFERDFAASPEGRVAFMAAIRQIQNSVRATTGIEALSALQHAHQTDSVWASKNRPKDTKSIREYYERDRDRFAIAQKDEHGLEKLSVEINEELDEVGGNATAFIMPSSVANYVEFRPENTEYSRAGPLGPQRVNSPHALDSPNPTRWVKEAPVYLYRAKRIEGVGMSDPLGRIRQNGSYNTMFETSSDFDNYKSSSRNIQIYDEDIDNWATIKLKDAIEYCGLFKENKLITPSMLGRNYDQSIVEGMRMDMFLYDANKYDNSTDAFDFKSVQYFGDMNVTALPVESLLNSARGLLGALRRRIGETEYVAVGNMFTELNNLGVDDKGLYPKYDANAFSALANVAKQFTALVGNDNLLNTIPDDFAKNIYNAFIVPKNFAAVFENTVVTDDNILKIKINKAGEATIETILQTIPSESLDSADKIVEESASVEDAINQLQVKMVGFAKDKKLVDKDSKFKFKTPAAVNKWIGQKLSAYKKQVESIKSTVDLSSSDGPKKIAGYMKAGQDLSNSKYSYLHSAAANRTDISSGIETLPIFAEMVDKHLSSQSGVAQQRRQVVGQSRGGFSGIGQTVYAPDYQTSRKKDTSARFGINGSNLGRLGNFGSRVEEISNSGMPAVDQMAAVMILASTVTKATWNKFVDNNIPLPIGFILARPHQQRHMLTIIKAAENGKVGYTFFTMPNMEISHDAGTKYSHAHFTMWVRSIVLNPENVYVVRDAFADAYLGGNNSVFFTPESYLKKDLDNMRESIICMAVPIHETRVGDPKSGMLALPGYFGYQFAEKFDQNELPHYTTYLRYTYLYGFNKHRNLGAQLPTFSNTSRHMNLVCLPAGQRHYSPDSPASKWQNETANKDAWGNIFGPGAASVRAGKKKYLSQATWKSKFA